MSFAGRSLFSATLLQVYFRKNKSALDWQLRLEWTFDKVLAACCQLKIVLSLLQNLLTFRLSFVEFCLLKTNNMSRIDLNLLKLRSNLQLRYLVETNGRQAETADRLFKLLRNFGS